MQKLVFPVFQSGGGCCYFVRDREYSGECEVISFANLQNPSRVVRNLNQFGVFVRYNEAIDILNKIKQQTSKTLSSIVASYCPFGLRSYTRGKSKAAPGLVGVYTSQGVQYIDEKIIKANRELIHVDKVLLSSLTAEHANEPDSQGRYKILSTMKVISKNTACTDSYLILGPFNNSQEAKNCSTFLKTKFARFLIMLSISSIHLTRESFKFVPLLDFTRPWTDEDLRNEFHLSDYDVDLINRLIREY